MYAGKIVRNVPNAELQKIKINTTVGNFKIFFIDTKENSVLCVVFPYFFKSNDETIPVAIANVANWNKILYVTSKFSSKNVPISGPTINPPTKNPINFEIDLTRVCGDVTLDMIDSQGGQKNECAMPVIALKTATSGTDCDMDRR
jgi:hypothetical protein